MFAYCGNEPVAHADPEGSDAFLIIIEDQAASFGHVMICIEDNDGEWYWYSFSSARHNLYTFVMSSLWTNVAGNVYKGALGKSYGHDMTSFDGVVKFVENEAPNTAKKMDGVVYLTGNFSGAIDYLDGLVGSEIEYHLTNHNCMQLALDALWMSNGLTTSQKSIIEDIRKVNESNLITAAPNVSKNMLGKLGLTMWDSKKWYEKIWIN